MCGSLTFAGVWIQIAGLKRIWSHNCFSRGAPWESPSRYFAKDRNCSSTALVIWTLDDWKKLMLHIMWPQGSLMFYSRSPQTLVCGPFKTRLQKGWVSVCAQLHLHKWRAHPSPLPPLTAGKARKVEDRCFIYKVIIWTIICQGLSVLPHLLPV